MLTALFNLNGVHRKVNLQNFFEWQGKMFFSIEIVL